MYEWVDNSIALAREIAKKHLEKVEGYETKYDPFKKFITEFNNKYNQIRKDDVKRMKWLSDDQCVSYLNDSDQNDLWQLYIMAVNSNVIAIDDLKNNVEFKNCFDRLLKSKYDDKDSKNGKADQQIELHKVTRYLYFVRPDLFIPVIGHGGKSIDDSTGWRKLIRNIINNRDEHFLNPHSFEEYVNFVHDIKEKAYLPVDEKYMIAAMKDRMYGRSSGNDKPKGSCLNMGNDIDIYVKLLKSRRNLILTGAPGTGKTYLARQIAEAMNDGLKTEDRKNTVGFVQFHPSYDYVDFVEGLRPDRSGDNVVFKRDDGIFKKFCKKAIKDHEHNYVFIIDEINRGDLSKIFGELFFAIDPGYRGEKGRVKTQYQQLVDAEEDDVFSGEGFYVPDNVYIIGTMNDIDRSVENMDFALRRRFAWKKISPEDTAESMGITGEVRQRMDAMNKAICSIPELGEDYQIGGAYFLKLKDENLTAEELWQFHLESLIGEYLRGLPNKDELYKKIKNAYDNPNKEAKTSENPAED